MKLRYALLKHTSSPKFLEYRLPLTSHMKATQKHKINAAIYP
jgi:hypothetical protein